MSILHKLEADIEQSINRLNNKNFKIDPIAGRKYSKVPSLIGSMQKRHGLIIEKAISAALSSYDHYTVWTDSGFKVSSSVNHIISTVNNVKKDPDWLHLLDHNHPYGEQSSTLQIDVIAFNKSDNSLTALEVKRGYSHHDAGKKKAILRRALAVQMLLMGYGQSELGQIQINEVRSRICSYYGANEFAPEIQITKDDLDNFFGVPILGLVQEVNDYFRSRIHELMELEM